MSTAQRWCLCAVLFAVSITGQVGGAHARQVTVGHDEGAAERAMLERVFAPASLDSALFTDNLLQQGTYADVLQEKDAAKQALGAYRSVSPQQNHQYYVHFAKGLLRAYIELDAHGLIDTLYFSDPKPYANRVLVGGIHMYIQCEGHGSPTVLLDAGLGGDTSVWDPMLVAPIPGVRTCAYDRAGNGGSDALPGSRTSTAIAQTLHALLAAAHIRGPYVLVAHSIAGFNVRVYAARYPKEVAGVVCVDCAYPYQEQRFAAALGPARPGESAAVHAFRTSLNDYSNPEGFDELRSASQVEASGLLTGLPLVVLTAGSHQFPLPVALAQREEAAWQGMQDELAGLSLTGLHVFLPNSGHDIMADNPATVVTAIEIVVHAAHSHNLPDCATTFDQIEAECIPQ